MNKLYLLLWLMECVNTHPWMIPLVRALFSLGRDPEPFPWIHFVSSFLTAVNGRDIQVFQTSTAGVRLNGYNPEYGRFTSLGNCSNTDVGVQPKLLLYRLIKDIVRSWPPNHRYAVKPQMFLRWTFLPVPTQYPLIPFFFVAFTAYWTFCFK